MSGVSTLATRPAGGQKAELEALRAENVALRQQVATLREALDALPGSVVVHGPDRRFVLANRGYHEDNRHLPSDREIAGDRYEQLLERAIDAGPISDEPAVADTAACLQRRIEATNRRGRLPGEAPRSDPGRETHHARTGRWVLVRSRRTASGNEVTLRVDITALKEAQRALQEAREAAETASRMKSQFLAQVSHELRSPLNAVINFAQLLTSEVHGPLGALDYKVYANDIVESGQHLMDLIRELLDLAQAEAGRLGIREGIVNLAPIVQAVCRQMAPEAARSEVSLSHDEEAQLPRLRGDGDRLRQVLVNLVNNAIKFTAPGGHVRVRLVRALDGGVCLTVHDTGMGIPATEIERVMLPFEQMAACLADRNAGVGLGLPLARHLMELHGGALTLESETGVGTVATVTIPVDRMIL